ncbi:Calcineurin metallo-phosphoesterase superfamily protein [Trifolium repens]|nr:Calcineurin metallo-phosphoesterase superfamily protein [Trifolium repens]
MLELGMSSGVLNSRPENYMRRAFKIYLNLLKNLKEILINFPIIRTGKNESNPLSLPLEVMRMLFGVEHTQETCQIWWNMKLIRFMTLVFSYNMQLIQLINGETNIDRDTQTPKRGYLATISASNYLNMWLEIYCEIVVTIS